MSRDTSITREKLAQKLNVAEATVKRELSNMQSKGIIKREGGRKNGKWVVLINL